MAYQHRDVVVGLDGQLHHVVLGHVAGWAAIDAGPPFQVQSAVSVRLAVAADGAPWITYADHETGLTYVRPPDGVERPIGGPVGAYGQGICASAAGVAVYVRGGNDQDLTTVTAYDGTGAAVQQWQVPYSPQIHRIDPDGYPVTDTDPRANLVRTIGGITLYNCAEDHGWIVGHADGNVAGQMRGVAVLVSPSGTMEMYPYETEQSPQSPRIALGPSDARPWVALSSEDTPEPNAVPWQPFVAWAPQPIERPTDPAGTQIIKVKAAPGTRIIIDIV